MEYLMAGLTPQAFAAALAITCFAGFVKGAVGFAMPMIMISAFSSFLPPETALAGLILPTLISNLAQAFRQGVAPAWETVITYRRMLIATVIFIVISAQFVRAIPQDLFLLLLGLPITAFAALQLAGVGLALRLEHRTRAEWILGAIGGLYGGVSGVWGPPLLVYLLSIKADKLETVRVQGVVFLIGAAILMISPSALRRAEPQHHRVFRRAGAARDDRPVARRRHPRPPRSVQIPPLDANPAGADRPQPDAPGGWPLIAKT